MPQAVMSYQTFDLHGFTRLTALNLQNTRGITYRKMGKNAPLNAIAMNGLQIIQKKLTASICLLVIFGVLIITNQAEKRHATQISEAASSLYKDRLVVESYIFKYYRHLHHIKETVSDNSGNDAVRQSVIRQEIGQMSNIDALYLKTVLTPEERDHFSRFHQYCLTIKELNEKRNLKAVAEMSSKSLNILDELSAIQLAEGQVQMDNVGKITSASSLYSQLEMGMLVVIALVIQGLVFTSRKFKTAVGTTMSLN